MVMTSTITSKGQITLPKNIRDIIKTNIVEFEVINDEIRLKPVRSMAGTLSRYAIDKATPLKEVRKKVWEEVVHGKKR